MALSLSNSTANCSGLIPDVSARSSEVIWERSRCSTVSGDLQRRAGEIHRLELDYHPVDLADILFQSWSPLDRDRSERMPAQDEKFLFCELNVAKQRLSEGRQRLDPDHPDPLLLSELEAYRDRADAIHRHLVEVFFKLAISVARSFSDPQTELDDLIGQACVTLIRSVELFDPHRGYRFSSYATRAIRTELGRFVTRQRKRAFVSLDSNDLICIHDQRSTESEQRLRRRAISTLDVMIGELEQREAHVVRSRFGLSDHPGCTLQSLADEYGVTRERVRQLERRAITKLRQMAATPERQQAFDTLEECLS